MKTKKLQCKRIGSRFRDLFELMYKRQHTQGEAIKRNYNHACSDHLRLLEELNPGMFDGLGINRLP